MEQFANLASSTLASAYSVGAGSITVASAASFPTQGTFTVVIRDQSTKAIKLLFRVTSVAGAVFSGAAEGTDAAANSGDLVDGTMVTVASLAQFKTDVLAAVAAAIQIVENNAVALPQEPKVNLIPGSNVTITAVDNPGASRTDVTLAASAGSNPFIQSLTAPVAANFTQTNYNTGASVVTTESDLTIPVTAITIKQHDPAATLNMALLMKSKLAATFTITIGFSFVAVSPNNLAGIWLSDSAAGPNIIGMFFQSNNGLRISLFSNYTTYGSDIANLTSWLPIGPLAWLRIQETVSARIYSVSSDGVNWAQAMTEANSAHFTTTKYGFGVECRGSGANNPDTIATFYHFSETNP